MSLDRTDVPNNAETADGDRGERPLESWKEIGAYLQRNVVTARRWEKEEGLPIHRHSHKSRSSIRQKWRPGTRLISRLAMRAQVSR